ncbi:hypothetical protein JW926_15145, partial [Candidatus Sumerlaeota bacterium]|nr:hypothetical protein [Candidatus Sumerlaeota bacterium]
IRLRNNGKNILANQIAELGKTLHGDWGLRNVIAHAGIVRSSPEVNFDSIEEVLESFREIAEAISEIDPYRDLIS